MFSKRKVAALVAEFLATGVLTLVVLSVQRSTIGVPYFVAIAAGLVVAMAMFVFGSVSGAHANPAITIAMWTARRISSFAAVAYVVVQLLGAWAAYAVYTYFVNNSLQPIGGEYNARILVAEAVGTLVLALGWASIAFRSSFTLGNRAAVVGLSYALAVIVAAGAGVGLVNPAVALGTRAWEVFGSMGWGTYVLGPILGAVIGVNLYGLLFAGTEKEDAEKIVVEEVVVSETATAAPVAANSVAAPKRKTTTRKTTTTARKSTAAKKPAAKRSSSK